MTGNCRMSVPSRYKGAGLRLGGGRGTLQAPLRTVPGGGAV